MKYTFILIMMLIVAGGCSRQSQSDKLLKKKAYASLSKQPGSKLEKGVTTSSNSAPKAEAAIPSKPVPIPKTVKLSTMPQQSISTSPRLELSDQSVVYKDTLLPETRLTKVKKISQDPALSGKFSRIKKETKAEKKKGFIKPNSGLSQP